MTSIFNMMMNSYFPNRREFWGHGTPDFCRVNAKLNVRVPKILGGPRPPQQVVSARLKMGARIENLLRTRFVSCIAKILCLYKQIPRETTGILATLKSTGILATPA
jgi:hypothetical protein